MKSFECAIARSQIGRYLAGDSLGDEAMRQLESHITACADCQRLIEGKREELLGPLAHAPTASEAIAIDTVTNDAVTNHTAIEETLANSTDVAAIERELRAAAARAGRAVIETAEVREVVAVGTAPTASAASNPISSAPSGISRSSVDPVATTVTSESVRTSSQPGRSGIGGALGRLSVPRLVRDIPEIDEEPAYNPAPARATVVSTAASAAEPTKANRSLTKAGVYAAALVLVLGGMAFLGDPTKLLGGKAAAAPAKAAVAMKPAPKKPVAEAPALATGVRRSALGVPITDAADPEAGTVAANSEETPKTPKAKALMAKADSAETEPTASDAAESEALMLDAAVEGEAPTPRIAKALAAKTPVAKVESNVVATRTTIPTAPASKAAVKAKITPLKAAPTKSVRAAKPIVAKVRVTTSRVKSAGPTTSIDAVPVAPARTTTKSVVRRSRPATPRATVRATVRKRATNRVVKRPAAPKATNVIRVYDETGKPLN